ncbi:hypothetical protein GQ53DRAFT_659094 [Thozetella sp. PMI_491]|nr:hypothetical protein GQ53DRAFT_659094 [Thozetella sp. PMI_491]
MSHQSRRYMSKRDRPCDFCRSRKSACHFDHGPPCRLCAARGRHCTFDQAPPPRQRLLHCNPPVGPGSPLSSISLQPQLMDSIVQSAMDDLFPDAPASHLWEELPGYTMEENFGLPSWDADLPSGADFGFPMASPSIATATPPSNESTSEEMLNIGSDTPVLFTGFTGEWDPYIYQRCRFDCHNKLAFRKITHLSLSQSVDETLLILTDPSLYTKCQQEVGHADVSRELLRQRLQSIISVDVGRRLIGLYQLFVAPQFPIFSTSSPLDPVSSDPCLLATVYAIVQPFVQLDEHLVIEFAYEVPPYAELLQLAHSGLQPQLHSPSLSTVQILLLLLVRPSTDTSVSESPMKWSLLCTLVAAAHALGLHDDPTPWSNLPPWLIAQRRRISFLIYSTDKWIACSLGRPPILQSNNWLVTSLTTDDELQSELGSYSWSCLMQYSDLCEIIDKMLSELFSLRNESELRDDYQKTLQATKPFFELLSSWHQRFEQHTASDENRDSTNVSCSTICELGYQYIHITIFRAIMRPFIRQQSRLQAVAAEATAKARAAVRSGTRSAFEFVRSLNQDHVSNFWPQWTRSVYSAVGYFMLLLFVTSENFEEALCWIKDLQMLRKELRIKATFHPFLRLSQIRLQAMFWKDLTKAFSLDPHIRKALDEVCASSAPQPL